MVYLQKYTAVKNECMLATHSNMNESYKYNFESLKQASHNILFSEN